MIEYIPLVIAAAVVVLLMFLRTNTAISFLALCAGTVLVASSGDNMGLMASSLTSGIDSAPNVAKIVLLLVPFLVVSIMLRGQVHKTLLPLALIPAICTALLAVIFTNPLLTSSVSSSVSNTQTWAMLQQYQEPIVGIGLVVSIVMLGSTNKRPHDKHKKHGH